MPVLLTEFQHSTSTGSRVCTSTEQLFFMVKPATPEIYGLCMVFFVTTVDNLLSKNKKTAQVQRTQGKQGLGSLKRKNGSERLW